MNIELPVSVRDYASLAGYSRSYVRKAIADGYLEVNRESRPMMITGGELPLTIERWKAKLVDALKQLGPGTYGFDADGDVHVLVGLDTDIVYFSDKWQEVPRAVSHIGKLARAQKQRRKQPAERVAA